MEAEGSAWLLAQVETEVYLSVKTSSAQAARDFEPLLSQLALRLASPVP